MIFLSLGAGVQSSVMLMRAIAGDIDKPDHAIFADTGWEPITTHNQVDWCERQCKKAGIPFHRVSAGNIRKDMVVARTFGSGEYEATLRRYATMPLFVDTGKRVEGRIRRQCTAEYKLAPIRAKQRELLGYKPRQRIPPGACEVMIGISVDEARRASPSRDRWVDNTYPLIDPLRMTRFDCQHWWEENFPHIVLQKSACIGCPHRSDREWLAMARQHPEEFADACEFDTQIRQACGMQGESYLHRSLKPLAQVDLNDSQRGLDLEDEIYCAGGCGL